MCLKNESRLQRGRAPPPAPKIFSQSKENQSAGVFRNPRGRRFLTASGEREPQFFCVVMATETERFRQNLSFPRRRRLSTFHVCPVSMGTDVRTPRGSVVRKFLKTFVAFCIVTCNRRRDDGTSDFGLFPFGCFATFGVEGSRRHAAAGQRTHGGHIWHCIPAVGGPP